MSKLTKYMELQSNEDCAKDCKFLLFAIQQHINGNSTYSYKTDVRINKYNKLYEKLKIDNFIKQETKILKDCINFNIESGEEISSVSDINIFYYLKYFSILLRELTANNNKKFCTGPKGA